MSAKKHFTKHITLFLKSLKETESDVSIGFISKTKNNSITWQQLSGNGLPIFFHTKLTYYFEKRQIQFQ